MHTPAPSTNRVGLAALDLVNGRVLVVREQGRALFTFPGGVPNAGESDFHALRRELKEELDVNLLEHTIKRLHTFSGQSHGRPDGHQTVMTIYSANFEGTLVPSGEIAEMAWFGMGDRHRMMGLTRDACDWFYSHGVLKL